MTDTPERGSEHEPTEREWLEFMLSRRETELGQTPGWSTRSVEEVSQVEPRARDFLATGETLSRDQLSELARYLGWVRNQLASESEHQQIAGEAAIAAQQARIQEIQSFELEVRGLRDTKDQE